MLRFIEGLSGAVLKTLGAQSLVLTTDAGNVHAYDASGPGEQTFVLLHGMGTAATTYAGLFRGIRERAKRVVMIDLPGHGKSELAAERLGALELGAGIRGALDQVLGEAEPGVLMGTSLGGAVALRYALERPEHLRALMLISPGGAPLSDDDFAVLKKRFDLQTRDDARRFFAELMHKPPIYTRLFERGLIDQLSRPLVQGFLSGLGPDDFFTEAELGSLRVPTLLIWGKSDRILPRSSLDFYRRALPPSVVIEEPDDVGHSPHVEKPRWLVERLLAFASGAG